jgi:uncharacterized RDD family membrane protein YckC
MTDYGTPPAAPAAGGYSSAPAPAGGGMMAPTGPDLAGWPLRVAGYLIDSLLPAIPGGIIVAIGMAMGASGATADPATGAISGTNPLGFVIAGIGYLAMFVFQVWNRWIKGGKGQTIGRKMVGITLLGEQTGQPIGAGMAFVRDLAHILDSLPFYLGWLWPLWDTKRQTFADKVVKTVVVSAK